MTATRPRHRLVSSYSSRHDRLLEVLRTERAPVCGTLGPPGTSSHDAVLHLRSELAGLGVAPGFALRLFDRFEELHAELCAGGVDYALVPSAYRDATAFHWDPALRLAFHFARVTPSYGIAGRGPVPAEGEVSVAAMAEVRTILDSLPVPELEGREIRWIDCRSTHHAARTAAAGDADLAVTNDTSRTAFALHWIASRPGAEVVWLLFRAARDGERAIPLPPGGDER